MYIYEFENDFVIKKIRLDKSINTNYRFTVDYYEDLNFCSEILNRTRNQSMQTLINFLDNNKKLREYNLSFSSDHRKIY